MLHAAWRSLLARKLRLVMSAFAIVLGVAFVSGSLIFTDTLARSFAGVMSGTVGDVVVRPAGAAGNDMTQSERTLPAALADRIAGAEGVARVDGNLTVFGVYVVGADGKVVGGQGAPAMAVAYNDAPSAGSVTPSLTISSGVAPQGRDQVVLDRLTAERAGYRVGDTVSLVTSGQQPSLRATLVGTARYGEGGLAGATLAIFDTRTMQDLFFGGRDVVTDLWVTGEDGVAQAALRDTVAPLLPADAEAVTGAAAADEASSDLLEAVSFISTFLLVFAAVALVVGSFLIVNTFSILVAQRSRELALLRALGARRGQVSRAVLFEAFVVGLLGSASGLALGFALAVGIKALFATFGLDLAGQDLVFAPRTAIVAVLVGVVVTMLAAWLPARRAGRIPPVAAMRDDLVVAEAGVHRRVVLGGAMALVGAAAMAAGLYGDLEGATLPVLGLGILLVVLGVAGASPVLGRPVIAMVGAAYRRVFGTVGLLAEQNARRNPRRTAATASALMIGLALVSMMAVFGQSAKASVDRVVGDSFAGDYVVSNAIGNGFSPAVADRVERVGGVGTVARVRWADADSDGQDAFLAAVDGPAYAQVMRVPTTEGSLADLTGATVAVSTIVAHERDLAVGDTIPLTLAGYRTQVRVVATYLETPAVGLSYLTTLDVLDAAGVVPMDNQLVVTAAPGADPAALRTGLDAAVADLPTVTVKDQAEYAAEQRAPIDQLLAIIYALLGLAVVIAVLGIVNTLALSVIERTREVGLLRAVGMSRRQLRRMVRLESTVIALLGAVLGVVLGTAFGVALQRASAGDGLDVLAVPYGQLALFVGLAAVVGVLAAVWPARRAARLGVLQAITTE